MSDVTLTNITDLVRNIIGDYLRTDSDVFEYVSSAIFTLTEENTTAVSSVYLNGALLATTDYSYDITTQKVTITASLDIGDSIEIFYIYYAKYSTTELNNYVKSALTYLAVYNYKEYYEEDDTIYPEPSSKDKSLIAVIASIIVSPKNSTIRTPDMTIMAPEGSLPLQDMIQKTITVFKSSSHGIFYLAWKSLI